MGTAVPRTRPDLAALPAYVPGKSKPGIIKLASNETTQVPLPSVLGAIADAAQGLNRYPDNGAVALREALAAKLGVAVGNVAVGCGSVSLCEQLMQATCADGDEVLFAWRSFEAYPLLARIVGATPVQVALSSEHVHDLDAMVAAISDRTRLIFVCNPNNPTGTVVSKAELERFLAAVPAHVVVVLDEAYFEYLRPDGFAAGDVPDGVELGRTRPNVVVLRTFSKAYGLAGLRVGYAVGDPTLMATLGKVYVPFSVNSLAQAAAIASLAAQEELLARTDDVVSERVRVAEALRDVGYIAPPSQANFVWLPLGALAVPFAQDCADAGVLIRPFAGEGVRVTIGAPSENDAFLRFALPAGSTFATRP